VKFRIVSLALCLLALYGAGLGFRREVVQTQQRIVSDETPFTLESALRYRRVKMVYDTGRMPVIDPFVQYPEGVVVRETYEFGSEYLQAGLAKCLPESMSVTSRFRWIEAAWFCLGIPFMGLWIAAWTGRWSAGLTAAAFYTVAFSSISRSTGLELSNENYALPLLIAYLAFDALSGAAPTPGRRLVFGVASAFLLAWSLWWWDLIQFFVLLWSACVLFGALTRKEPPGEGETIRFVLQASALVFVGMASPYHRSHALLGSPAMSLLAGAVMLMAWDAALRRRHGVGLRDTLAARFSVPARAGILAAVVLLPFAASSVLRFVADYQSSYGHFAELLYAKIRYLNAKPADPALLTFDQRIMWVPALHSADVRLTKHLFPAILPLSFVGVTLVYPLTRKRSIPRLSRLVVFYTVSLAAYWFFVRFQVYVAVFAAAVLGTCVALARVGWAAWLVRALLVLGFMVETANAVDAVRKPERSGRPHVYYGELAELAAWLRAHASPDPVLANFGVSGSIAAYGKCPVVLHPKFESGPLRDRVKEYAELLFTGTEREFRDWADRHGAKYFVYAMGEFAQRSPELQLRYMANAMDPPDEVPARLFESNPARLDYFRRLWGNRKYAVYAFTGIAEERKATVHAAAADAALRAGDMDAARSEAEAALKIAPGHDLAQQVLRHVMSLEQKGFSHRVEDESPAQ
jgi:hypothetical protein